MENCTKLWPAKTQS